MNGNGAEQEPTECDESIWIMGFRPPYFPLSPISQPEMESPLAAQTLITDDRKKTLESDVETITLMRKKTINPSIPIGAHMQNPETNYANIIYIFYTTHIHTYMFCVLSCRTLFNYLWPCANKKKLIFKQKKAFQSSIFSVSVVVGTVFKHTHTLLSYLYLHTRKKVILFLSFHCPD